MDPVFSIHVGQSSADSRVVCNGQDISPLIRKIEFSCEAGSLSVLKLTAIHAAAVADIAAAIKDVTVEAPGADCESG